MFLQSKQLLYLYINSGVGASVPIIIYFYIGNSYPAEQVANIAVSEAISLIICAIAMYSFEIVGMKMIAEAESNLKKEKNIFINILMTRIFITLAISAIVLIVYLITRIELLFLVICWIPNIFAICMQSQYFYLAKNQNKRFALYNSLSRILSCILILITSSVKIEYYYIPLIIGISHVIFILMLINNELQNIRSFKFSLETQKKLFKEGFTIFTSNISVVVLKDINTLLMKAIGLTSTMIVYYVIAEKIVKGLQALIRPFNKYLAKDIAFYKGNKQKDYIIKQIKNSYILLIFIIIIVLIASFLILKMGLINVSIETIIMTSIMLFTLFVGVNNFFLGPVYANMNNKSLVFLKSILISAIISLISNYFLISYFTYGPALSFLFSELVLFVILSYSLKFKYGFSSQV